MNPRTISFELLLISTWFLGVMAVKFMLPSLPNIAEQLHTSDTLAKYTISIFLLGKATGMLAFGPLSERYGRKPFMLLGLALFCLGNMLAFIANSIEFLLFARLIQGFGVSATVMIGRAMVNDIHESKKAVQVFSYIFFVASTIIVFLPTIGGFLATHYPWRIAFFVMAAYSSVIFILSFFYLRETHTPDKEINLHFSQLFTHYKTIIRHPLFLGYVLCSVFMVAGESAFNTASSFLLIKTFGLSKTTFGFLITSLAIGHLIGTLFCGRLVKKYDLANMMGIGVSILAASALIMVSLVYAGQINVWFIMLPMIIFYIGTGFVMTITAVGAVIPFPKMIGISSAASLLINFSCSALSSAIMSHLPTYTAKPMSLLIAACGGLALLAWLFLIRPNKKMNVIKNSLLTA